jgi:transketolase
LLNIKYSSYFSKYDNKYAVMDKNLSDSQSNLLYFFQTEIAKRLNAICAQVIPFLSQEHQQQVAAAVERAKQVTMTELNAIIGVGS